MRVAVVAGETGRGHWVLRVRRGGIEVVGHMRVVVVAAEMGRVRWVNRLGLKCRNCVLQACHKPGLARLLSEPEP